MKNFVTITPNGQFALDGNRWYCNSTIYFGHHPGAMKNWFTNESWPINEPVLDRDFGRMAALGLNHTALFLTNDMFFDNGRPVQQGYDRMDDVVETAKKHGLRVTLFMGGFIDNAEEYRHITGKEWEDDNRWLPSFNPALFDAYVTQTKGLVERYRNEPTVLGYGDRIDRFCAGFDNVTIPFNLKEEWAAHLKRQYGKMEALREAMGGKLEGDPREFHQVRLPQESKFNASLQNPLGYEYILWQKKTIGDTQARWDAEMVKLAPQQIFWTPFEGCTLDWAMLDGFTPETKKLQAIWMEYYHWQAVRTYPVGPFEEWAHTREFVTQRLHHESPTIYNTAYLMTRYVKLSTQRPVVICHGGRLDAPTAGAETEAHQLANIDRVNAACLAADADGWHYWCFTDDWQSSLSHAIEQKAHPHEMYWQGESLGLYDDQDHPRPAASLVRLYSDELQRRTRRHQPVQKSEVLLLNSAAVMYSLFRRMATPTAAAVNGALQRLGVAGDYLWTAQNDVQISQATLDSYKCIVIADHMYARDFRDMPEKLLHYVQTGGSLYYAPDQWDAFADEHGIPFDSPAMRTLSGVDPSGNRNWPGARTPCRNWPFPGETPREPNFDALAFPRLHWGICPEFRHISPVAQRQQMLGFRSYDEDRFMIAPGLVAGAEVIAVGKFNTGSKPFIYRHRIGKGTVYVNAWTNNVFRDSDRRPDYGGWEYDWILALPLESAEVNDRDLTGGAALWLRNTWGYFWKQM